MAFVRRKLPEGGRGSGHDRDDPALQRRAARGEGDARVPRGLRRVAPGPLLSHRMYLLISFRKSTPPQNRQLDILISKSEQSVDDFRGGLTF